MQTARLHGKAVLLCSGVDVARSATDCPLRKGAVAPALAAQPVGVRRGGSAVAPLAAREALRGRLPPHTKKINGIKKSTE